MLHPVRDLYAADRTFGCGLLLGSVDLGDLHLVRDEARRRLHLGERRVGERLDDEVAENGSKASSRPQGSLLPIDRARRPGIDLTMAIGSSPVKKQSLFGTYRIASEAVSSDSPGRRRRATRAATQPGSTGRSRAADRCAGSPFGRLLRSLCWICAPTAAASAGSAPPAWNASSHRPAWSRQCSSAPAIAASGATPRLAQGTQQILGGVQHVAERLHVEQAGRTFEGVNGPERAVDQIHPVQIAAEGDQIVACRQHLFAPFDEKLVEQLVHQPPATGRW